MKTIIKLSFVLVFLSTTVSAQLVRPGVTLHRNWSVSAEQNILGSDLTGMLNVFCGYYINSASGNKDGVFSLFDIESNDTITYLPHNSLNTNVFYSVAISDGNAMSGSQPILCAGYEETTPGDKDFLIHYQSVSSPIIPNKNTDDVVFTALYNQEARYIKQTGPGSFYFWTCGYDETSTGNNDFWFAKIYADGGVTMQWDTTFGGSGEDVLNSFAYNMNGAILFTGYTTSSPALGKDIKSILFSQSNDSVMVDTSFSIPGDQELNDTYFDYFTYSMMSVGYSDTTGSNKDFFVVYFDQMTGDTLWTRTFGTPYNDEAKSIKIWDGGTGVYFLVSGYTTSPDGDKNNYVALLDMSGNIISQRIFGKPGIDECINTTFADNCQYFLFGNEGNDQAFNMCVAYNYNVNVSNVTCTGYGDGSITFVDESSALIGNANPELYDKYLSYLGSGNIYTSLLPDTFILQFYYSFGAKSDCFMQDTIIITEPDALDATISTTDPDCMGNPGMAIISPFGGVPPYTVDWFVQQGGDTLFTSTPGESSVSLTDVNGCMNNFSYTMNPHFLPAIYGAAITATDSIRENHGKAILYKLGYTGSAAELDSITSYVIDTNNVYNFASIEPGDYKIMIQIDSTSYYPNYLDSYFSANDTVITWQMGDTISVACDDNFVNDVNMYLMNPMETGIGSISGYIYLFTYTKEVGEPVPGAEILIEQEPNDVPVQCVFTDTNGYYEADGLEAGSLYSMQVQIPGYPMINTYIDIPITTTDTLYEEMNFYVDTTLDGGILADTLQTHIYTFTNDEFILNVFPNPFNTSINFEYNLYRESRVNSEIVNLNGQIIDVLMNEKREKGKTTVIWQPASDVPAGTYMLRTQVENQILIKKILLIK